MNYNYTPETAPNRLPTDYSKVRIETIFSAFDNLENAVQNSAREKNELAQRAANIFSSSYAQKPAAPVVQSVQMEAVTAPQRETDLQRRMREAQENASNGSDMMNNYFAEQGANL